jgi:sugar phosphate isomerase/epimerase
MHVSDGQRVLTGSTESLVMATQTVPPETSLPDRVRAAAAGGFSGIGLRPRDRAEALAGGLSDADARAVLSDHGVALVELEVHRGWGLTGEPAEEARAAEQRFYELADAYGGGRHMMAVGEIEGELDDVAERFAGLCDRAAEHGLAVAIEFLPWTSIPDAGVAWDIVRLAGRGNGGVLVDTWHHFRGAADDDLIRAIPPDRIICVQFDDADAEIVGTMLEDTIHRRRLPGDGSFDLEHFVRLMDGHGVRCPWSVEILSDELRRRTADEAAVAAGSSTRAVLSAAREQGGGR